VGEFCGPGGDAYSDADSHSHSNADSNTNRYADRDAIGLRWTAEWKGVRRWQPLHRQ
jgi:hypothetical protein